MIQQHLSEGGEFTKLRRSLTALKTEDRDSKRAQLSDEDLEVAARMLLKARGLPPGQLPEIQRQLDAARTAARERLTKPRN